MGAWSHTPFGNDAARDWLGSLVDSDDAVAFIEATLDAASRGPDDEPDKLEAAIAAAALIFGATQTPVRGINSDAKSWIERTGFNVNPELIRKAVLAIDAITRGSELADLWMEAEGYKGWISSCTKIRSSLEAALQSKLPTRSPKKPGMPRALYKLAEFCARTPQPAAKQRLAQKIDALGDVNEATPDTNFDPPLALMASHGLADEVKMLIARGADPDLHHWRGRPLWLAIRGGHLDVAEVLLEAGVKLIDEIEVDARRIGPFRPGIGEGSSGERELVNHPYCIALMIASRSGGPETIDYLLSKGADVHQVDMNGATLVHHAAESSNLPALKHLLDLGLEVDACQWMPSLRYESRDETALFLAVRADALESVRLLLERGADVNARSYCNSPETPWDMTPLDIVHERPESKVYRLLVSHGAKFADELKP